MSVNNFIPEIWSARIFKALENTHVLANRCNREYEGEISDYGDTVKITALGSINVGTYTPNSTTLNVQELDDAQISLTIDQAKYFAFKIDDVDRKQTNPDLMDEAMRKAGYALAESLDDVIAALYASAGTTITNGGSTAVTSANVLAVIGYCGQKLDEANVPREGRWMCIPPWFHTKLVLSKILQTDGSIDATEAYNKGYVGSAMGFDFYLSNNITTTGTAPDYTSQIMAGTNRAITLAEQIVKTEAYRPEGSFTDAVKGLHVYGYKVVDPNALLCLTAVYATDS